MPVRLRVAAACRDFITHAGPFFEPSRVVADVILERTSDAMNLVDLDTGPGRCVEANEQPHGPAIVGGKIQKGRVVFAADHVLLLIWQVEVMAPHAAQRRAERSDALQTIHAGFSPRMVTRRISRRSFGLKSVRACSVQRLSQITRSPARQTCS